MPPNPSATEIAEVDGLRSEFMRELLSKAVDVSAGSGRAPMPRLLVQFWDDLCALPDDVRACLESWAPLEEAGFERMLFDDTSARSFIDEHFSEHHLEAFDHCNHPAMRADYFRLCLILRAGGMYVDADDEYQGADIEPMIASGRLHLQALCYDITSASMIDVTEALTDGSGSERIFYVNNNPLIARAGHPIIARALERSTELLLTANRPHRDLQSVTGPGNLTASLVEHAARKQAGHEPRDFELLTTWDDIAISKWPLSYRSDARNWRNWVREDTGEDLA